MKILAGWLTGAALCLRLAAAAAGSAPPSEQLRIVCDGITTATLAGQDLIYAGRSDFDWGALQLRVDGQLHVFCGVSLTRTVAGTRARTEIQSITANGTISVRWRDGSIERQLQGTRLVIRPNPGTAGGESITLAGHTDANGHPQAGVLSWRPAKLDWVSRPPTPKP